MKAIQLTQFGIEHLQLTEIPVPAIDENEVLVKTTAVALEFHDLIVVENRIPFGIPLPHIPVSEGVGVVESVGSKVSRWKKGDRVMIPFISRWEAGKNTPYNDQLRTGFSLPGLLAEYTVQPENTLVRTPNNLTDEEAAPLPVTGKAIQLDPGATRTGRAWRRIKFYASPQDTFAFRSIIRHEYALLQL